MKNSNLPKLLVTLLLFSSLALAQNETNSTTPDSSVPTSGLSQAQIWVIVLSILVAIEQILAMPFMKPYVEGNSILHCIWNVIAVVLKVTGTKK